MRPIKILFAFFAVTLIAGAAETNIDHFFDKTAADWMRMHPQNATLAQYFSGREQSRLDRQMTIDETALREAEVRFAKEALANLKKFDQSKLSHDRRISASMLAWQFNRVIESRQFDDYRFPLNQFRGTQVSAINFLTQMHPIRNRRDIENYLARLNQIKPLIDNAIRDAKAAESKGILPPSFIIDATIEQIGRFLAPAPIENVFVSTLQERAAKLKNLSQKDQARFVAAAEKIVTREIIPAFQRAQELLKKQLLKSTDHAGLSRFPNGPAAYADKLRHFTTTELSADQIHQIGLQEVARIEKRMDELLRKAGYTEGSVKERMKKLDADLQPKEADPRSRLLTKYTEIIREAEKKSDALFDLRPKAKVEVRREPPVTEKNAAAHYTPPARDGTRPGIFWAPLPGPTYKMSNMRTLAYHEAVPGHHFQIALQQEEKSLPRFRQIPVLGIISAFAEGWALYSEQLAAEAGWYEGDIHGELGQLEGELFRARRLVVDTGLHAKNWTRQQAIDYGMPISEVERYVVLPGQACSYKIGQLKILELRERAKKALGEKFDLKQFHNTVLRTGAVPLDVLEQAIDTYIQSTK
jgi:uncharacterized protein (DUF885 family)